MALCRMTPDTRSFPVGLFTCQASERRETDVQAAWVRVSFRGLSASIPIGATENAQANPATVARAAVDPVASCSSVSASTTEQLEQEAIRVLKRLACLQCIEETPSVEAGGVPLALMRHQT